MSFSELSTAQFRQKLSQTNGLLLDVRSYEEYEEKHIEGSLLIPLDELELRVEELSAYRHEPVLIYCKAGVRSFYAGSFLVESGFSNVSHLLPGILGWINDGNPVVH